MQHVELHQRMELNLIMQASELDSTSTTVVLDGRRWKLMDFSDTPVSVTNPNYVCISYVWGDGRIPSPFDRSQMISDQTVAALEVVLSATRDSEVQAFWIDALCIPASGRLRQATLESMGYIYTYATEVFIVLSKPIFTIIEHMDTAGPLDENVLELLEQDLWVASVWTYQELVNSIPRFVSMDRNNSGLIVEGGDFFHSLACYLELYQRKHSVTSFRMRTIFPRLSALEETMLVWQVNAPLGISALQVMSNMDQRIYRAGEPQNYFYAMMGAITTAPAWGAGGATIAEVSDRFMTMCERKNDYSFIYSSAVRDERVGKRWRPAPGLMKSILPWHSYGEPATGYHDTAGFWLCGMVPYEVSTTLGTSGKEMIATRFLSSATAVGNDDTLAAQVYAGLVSIGFTGSQEYMTLEDGFLFPQTVLPKDSKRTILVSGNVVWPFGAPGLVIVTSEDDLTSYVPSAFIGDRSRRPTSSVLVDPLARVE